MRFGPVEAPFRDGGLSAWPPLGRLRAPASRWSGPTYQRDSRGVHPAFGWVVANGRSHEVRAQRGPGCRGSWSGGTDSGLGREQVAVLPRVSPRGFDRRSPSCSNCRVLPRRPRSHRPPPTSRSRPAPPPRSMIPSHKHFRPPRPRRIIVTGDRSRRNERVSMMWPPRGGIAVFDGVAHTSAPRSPSRDAPPDFAPSPARYTRRAAKSRRRPMS